MAVSPDHLLLWSRFELVDFKPEEKFFQIAEQQPSRYAKIDGVWRCPPAEETLRPPAFEEELADHTGFEPYAVM